MSSGSKFSLAATSLFAAGAMHAGVVRDMEQQRIKRERQLDFDMQRALEEEYKREQSVHSSLEPLNKASAGSR
ncbi:uncharacterized protein Triagg1_2650 [Trichoderma aggressivum f. europaeum]|uniref:Cytochrome c oxidase assembly protein n=1 Tax=Trichoderma aggressivum f. europaeum TaxID=173218 RepID=A0AAE1M1R1_9HYPO|nr:hypothetical protein Triagg1_2650 [Trichoderma aggressivum f. europaeum]